MPKGGPKTRAGGQWSEARYFAFIRSGLRKLSQKWPPIHEAKKLARRKYVGPNKRQRWEYQCCECRQWKMGTEIEVDHIDDCGRLAKFSDLPGFVSRLLCEVDGLRVVCKDCHQAKHA